MYMKVNWREKDKGRFAQIIVLQVLCTKGPPGSIRGYEDQKPKKPRVRGPRRHEEGEGRQSRKKKKSKKRKRFIGKGSPGYWRKEKH